MDLAFEIGISSAAQIALLVVPVLVIASLFLGNCRGLHDPNHGFLLTFADRCNTASTRTQFRQDR
ncbi:MAG TPA: hypothetical protein VHY78_07870 [Stellaceae bacterium]|jgi:Ca2+/H+ antiporter|nr:hypothetical protein [Stellaceae bacterium]